MARKPLSVFDFINAVEFLSWNWMRKRSWSSLSCFIACFYWWIGFKDRLCNYEIKRISLYYGTRIFWFSNENIISKVYRILLIVVRFLRNTIKGWCYSFQNQQVISCLIASGIFFLCEYYKIKLIKFSQWKTFETKFKW